MEKCQHVSKIRPAWDHSILNPQKWMCYMCRTTESVWACLSCSNVACGRFNEKHALDHYLESKHPISIEVNEKYIYCYVCDDYVMNDNAAGDLKLLRSALSAIATQKFTDIESRGRRLLRSYSHTGIIQRDNTVEDDKLATAAWHQRQRLLAKVFGAWRLVIQQKKMLKKRTPRKQVAESVTPTRSVLKKRTIIPGVTGLRNLGNSCYMNSVLQVLSHIEAFRDFFLKMKYGLDVSPNGSPQVSNVVTATTPSTSTSSASSTLSTPSSSSSTQSSAMRAKLIQRQTTVDCFQHLMTGKSPYVTPKRRSGGLNGGSNQVSPARQQLICEVESTKSTSENISLCAELHGLFRVLWSGKWAQVSPHAFLRAVWKAIPMFKGYAQHDAQEFLCELLDKIQRELDSIPKALRQADSKFLTDLFQGQLVSQVTCLACGNVSETYEPYLDLSLEFPDRYQITKQNPRIAQDICHITEMLAKFTEEEQLEGKIYSCEKCNKNRNKSSGKIYTEAKKQLLINRLPPFLRLHLKRFRWSGRNHREKISTHVAADEHLDLKPFCSDNSNQTTHTYHLFGVIIHHGKGFSSGHYTAYTWNCEADSWVNCNDSRMILSPLEEVLTAQAYILFYRVVNVEPEKFSSLLSQDSNTSAETLPYSLESEDMLMIDGEDSVKSHRQSRSSKSKLKSGKIESALSSSFKADGTEMFMSLDQLEGDESMMSEASVQVVDEEISFNFKSPSLEEIENQTIEKGVKRSLTCAGKEVEHHDTKRKRLSFEAGMFYTKTPEKTVPVKDSSCMSELSSNSVFPNKFVKDLPQSCTHVKRRKSTFW